MIPFSRIVEQVKKSVKSGPDAPAEPPAPQSSDEYVFVPYETAPSPVGGFAAIQQKLRYPEIARKAGIEGRVVIQALIGQDGNVEKTQVVQSLGDNGCDEAAIDAINAVQWHPAINRDLPVSVWIAVPIDFRLNHKMPDSDAAR